jgi:hypothetical protein
MSLYSITPEYNGPLEVAHAYIDNDGCHKVEWSAASHPGLNVFDHVHGI